MVLTSKPAILGLATDTERWGAISTVLVSAIFEKIDGSSTGSEEDVDLAPAGPDIMTAELAKGPESY
jgi:hypothetical protein